MAHFPRIPARAVRRVHGMSRQLLESLVPREHPESLIARERPESLVARELPAIAFLATCIIFGGLHLTAWNYPFVTEAEKITWRLVSLVLTGAPLAMLTGLTIALQLVALLDCTVAGIDCSVIVARACFVLGSCVGLCSRLGHVGLMFASLACPTLLRLPDYYLLDNLHSPFLGSHNIC
ncbi:hypothetical protein HD554DRAFT_2152974 [Boletus coccyginus]|nr:hypothetical protein HD554DRAFT_2152974 [Boletus coccyginus]